MKWNEDYFRMEWSQEITNYDEKNTVARIVASYARDNEVIGFGSGSTSFLAAQEIGRRIREEGLKITAIPTSNEIRMVCVSLGIPVATIDDVKPDWGFDGADEVTGAKVVGEAVNHDFRRTADEVVGCVLEVVGSFDG